MKPVINHILGFNNNPNILKIRKKLGLNSIEDRLMEI